MPKTYLKSKEIIDELKSMNIEVSNHMQALEDDQMKALDRSSKKQQKNDNKQSTQNNHQKSNNQNQNKRQQNKNKKESTTTIIKATKARKRIIEIIRKITK